MLGGFAIGYHVRLMRLDSTGYYALGVPFYLVMLLAEWWLARRRGLRVFRLGEALGNVSAGVGELVLGLFYGPLLLALYDFGYEKLALIRWQKDSLIPWLLAIFGLGHDLQLRPQQGQAFAQALSGQGFVFDQDSSGHAGQGVSACQGRAMQASTPPPSCCWTLKCAAGP